MVTINLQDFQKIGSGAFADVWADAKQEKVLKLFKSYNHPSLDGTGKEDWGEEKTNEYRRKVFSTELDAYHFAQNSELLKKHTPIFYGLLEFDKIFHEEEDVTHHYLKDCCLILEYVPGPCDKLMEGQNQLNRNLKNSLQLKMEPLLQEFVKVGIDYTLDSSVIHNSQNYVIIDFATMDPQPFEPIN